MREHKLSAGQLPMGPREPGPDNLKLDKIQVVRRELTTAIAIFFAQGDPVSVHVLASAASEVLTQLNEGAGNETFRRKMREVIKEEYRADWDHKIGEAYNFMKHAGKDPREEFEHFNPRINELIFLGAVTGYWQLAEMTPNMKLYLAWFNKFHPSMLVSGNEFIDAAKDAAQDWPDDPRAALNLVNEASISKGWDRP